MSKPVYNVCSYGLFYLHKPIDTLGAGGHTTYTPSFMTVGLYPWKNLYSLDVIHDVVVKGSTIQDKGRSYTARKIYWIDKETYEKIKQYILSAKDEVENNAINRAR